MDMELVKTYKLLQNSEQTEEVIQIKNQIKASLNHQIKSHVNKMFAIGNIIGFDTVKDEFTKAIKELEEKHEKAV